MTMSRKATVMILVLLIVCMSGPPEVGGRMTVEPDVGKRNLIKEAARITDIGMAKAREMLERAFTENLTEAEIGAEIMDAMTSSGSNPYVEAFSPIVASGNDSSYPHGNFSNDDTNLVLPGEVVTVDIGARFKGWVGDETRTFFMGDDPPEEFVHVYNIVLEAHDLSANALQVGKMAFQIDAVARDHIKSNGYGDHFTHCLGHGLGLQVHQPPMLCPDRNDPLMAWDDQVVTIEPGIYIEDVWGVRIEDNYAILRTGSERYTMFPNDLESMLVTPSMNQTTPEPDDTDAPGLDAVKRKAGIAMGGILALGIVVTIMRRIRRRRLRRY
jgi:Xaa-Pro aminopeptidase